MKTVGMMPIKLHNERLPGKNTKILGDKPLLQYSLNNLQATGLLNEIYVYCSSEDIVPFLPRGISFMRRPEYLDRPTSNFTQFFEAFIDECKADIYVMAHATAPFITTDTMRECIAAVQSGDYDSAFCARKIQTFLWCKGRPLNFDPTNLPRTQDLEPIYQETSGIYVFTRELFQKQHRRIGSKPYIKCVSFKEAVDIDGPKDFELAQILTRVEI